MEQKNEELPLDYPVKAEGIIRKFDLMGEQEVDPTEADRRKEEFLKRLKEMGIDPEEDYHF